MASARPFSPASAMIGWLIFALLAAAMLLVVIVFARPGRSGIELLLAATLVAAAGYAWQGSPGQPGSLPRPKPPAAFADDGFAVQRTQLGFASVGAVENVLAASDTLYRQRLGPYAVAQLRAALSAQPNNAELLTGLGQALVREADGVVTPAAKLAFDRARRADPNSPAPSYFLAMAYAQQGDLDSAEPLWRELLNTAPDKAPWVPLLIRNLLVAKAIRDAR
jgi:Flp pilus assembly protein TadD